MSQTDIPWTAAAGDDEEGFGWGRRRRGRRRRQTGAASGGHSGDRCRMCGETVVVDPDGRCRLGHQVVAAEVVAARLDEESADTGEHSGEDTREDVVVDVHEAPPRPREEVSVEITIDDPAVATVTPALGLPQHADVDRRWVPGLVIPGARLASPDPVRVVVAPPARPARVEAGVEAPVEAPVEARVDAPLPVMDEPLPPIPLPGNEDDAATDRTAEAPADAPAPPPPPRGAFDLEEGGGPRPIGYEDLTPNAASVLDVGPLPTSAPPAERTFEQVPLEEDDEGRAGFRWATTGIVLLVALVGIAVALAISP